MIVRKRRAVVMSLSGAALVLAACAGSSETSIDEAPADSTPEPLRDDAADREDKQASSDRTVSSCNYNDVWHCMAGHSEWRWVPLDEAAVRRRPPGGGTRCCVMVGPPKPRPYRR